MDANLGVHNRTVDIFGHSTKMESVRAETRWVVGHRQLFRYHSIYHPLASPLGNVL